MSTEAPLTASLRRTLSSSEGPVLVEVSFPMKKGEGEFTSYQADCLIRGLPDEGEDVHIPAEGADEIQALLIGLCMIGERLENSKVELSFLGLPGHGFPTVDSDADGMLKMAYAMATHS